MTQNASFPDKAKMCHRTGFAKSCRDLLDEKTCQGRWVHIQGQNMNGKGEPTPIDGYGCVDDVQYLLQQSFEYRLVGIQAAVEGRGDATQAALLQLTSLTANVAALTQQQHDEALQAFNKTRPLSITNSPRNENEPEQLEFKEMVSH